MRNFGILILGILFTTLSAFSGKQYTINAELVEIQYYSKCNCTKSNPILVRVKYKVRDVQLKNLKQINSFDGGISTTTPVTDIDKDGGVIYQFCISETGIKNFSTVFIDETGRQSNPVFVKVNPAHSKIIAGTAPVTLKVE